MAPGLKRLSAAVAATLLGVGCACDSRRSGQSDWPAEACVALERFPDGTEAPVCVRSELRRHGRRYDVCQGRAQLSVRTSDAELERFAARAAANEWACVVCAEISHLSGDGEHRLGIVRGIDCSPARN